MNSVISVKFSMAIDNLELYGFIEVQMILIFIQDHNCKGKQNLWSFLSDFLKCVCDVTVCVCQGVKERRGGGERERERENTGKLIDPLLCVCHTSEG